MRNKNQNKIGVILDDLQSHPAEEPFQKNAAWLTLELRLQKRSVFQRRVWFRAAACMAALITGIALFMHFNNSGDRSIQQAPPLSTSKIKAMLPLAGNEKIIPQVDKSSLKIFSGKKALLKTQVIEPGVAQSQPRAEMHDSMLTIEGSTNVTITVPLPDSALVAARLPKKLKVVYLGELNETDNEILLAGSRIRTLTKTNKTATSEYVGAVNFRIYLKN